MWRRSLWLHAWWQCRRVVGRTRLSVRGRLRLVSIRQVQVASVIDALHELQAGVLGAQCGKLGAVLFVLVE